MNFRRIFLLIGAAVLLPVMNIAESLAEHSQDFPSELVNWHACSMNPIFTSQGKGHLNVKMRERGYILKDGDKFHLWYTCYDGSRDGLKQLCYATSTNGYHWIPHANNPIYTKLWTEDMHVVKYNDLYYMVAEGESDIAHMLISKDGIKWKELGPLDIRMKNGNPITVGPRGTPTLWVENETWYLFYERQDSAVWLATSTDRKVWTHVQDEAVLTLGPARYDKYAIAVNQIIKYMGIYYAFYHASDTKEWLAWSTNIAKSKDLIHWVKYTGNPLIEDNKSSGVVVPINGRYWLYTMHEQIDLYLPKDGSCQVIWQQ